MKYIQENKEVEGCIFCQAAKSQDDVGHLVFYRGENAFMILNRYPYTSGHVMCVPYVHEAHLQDLTPETRSEIMELTTKSIQVLQSVYQPEGFNVGLNLGEMAGAGIEQHLHMHIVPRWGGDTNFMSTIGDTRLLPEALDQTYHRIKQAWDQFTKS